MSQLRWPHWSIPLFPELFHSVLLCFLPSPSSIFPDLSSVSLCSQVMLWHCVPPAATPSLSVSCCCTAAGTQHATPCFAWQRCLLSPLPVGNGLRSLALEEWGRDVILDMAHPSPTFTPFPSSKTSRHSKHLKFMAFCFPFLPSFAFFF